MTEKNENRFKVLGLHLQRRGIFISKCALIVSILAVIFSTYSAYRVNRFNVEKAKSDCLNFIYKDLELDTLRKIDEMGATLDKIYIAPKNKMKLISELEVSVRQLDDNRHMISKYCDSKVTSVYELVSGFGGDGLKGASNIIEAQQNEELLGSTLDKTGSIKKRLKDIDYTSHCCLQM